MRFSRRSQGYMCETDAFSCNTHYLRVSPTLQWCGGDMCVEPRPGVRGLRGDTHSGGIARSRRLLHSLWCPLRNSDCKLCPHRMHSMNPRWQPENLHAQSPSSRSVAWAGDLQEIVSAVRVGGGGESVAHRSAGVGGGAAGRWLLSVEDVVGLDKLAAGDLRR